MSARWIDTNAIVRYLAGDSPDIAARARRLLQAIEAGDEVVILEDVVLADAVWVLSSFYERARPDIADVLTEIVALPGMLNQDKPSLLRALTLYANSRIDFADALLAAKTLEGGGEIYSFDRDFDRVPGLTRIEPV